MTIDYLKYMKKLIEVTGKSYYQLAKFSNEEIDFILSSDNKSDAISLLENENFKTLSKEEQKEIIKIFGNLKYTISEEDKKFNLHCEMKKIVTNEYAIKSGNIMEFINFIISAKDDNLKMRMISRFATGKFSSSHKDILKICQLILDLKDVNDAICYISSAFRIFRMENVLEVFESILNAKSREEAIEIAFQKDKESFGISLLDLLETEKITELNFWDLMAEDDYAAGALLTLAKLSKEEIKELFDENQQKYCLNLEQKFYIEGLNQNGKNEELPQNLKVRKRKPESKKVSVKSFGANF